MSTSPHEYFEHPVRSGRTLVELGARVGADLRNGPGIPPAFIGRIHRTERQVAAGADRPEPLEAEYLAIGVDAVDAARIGDQRGAPRRCS